MFLAHYLVSALFFATPLHQDPKPVRWDTDQCVAQTEKMVIKIAITETECAFIHADIDGISFLYDPQKKQITEDVKAYEKFKIRILKRDSADFNPWRRFENKKPTRTVGDFYIYELDKNIETVFFSGADGQGVSAHQKRIIRAAQRFYKGLYIRYTYPDTNKNPRNADNQALEALNKIKSIGE